MSTENSEVKQENADSRDESVSESGLSEKILLELENTKKQYNELASRHSELLKTFEKTILGGAVVRDEGSAQSITTHTAGDSFYSNSQGIGAEEIVPPLPSSQYKAKELLN